VDVTGSVSSICYNGAQLMKQ